MITRILIVYDTDSGNTYNMAKRIARGVDGVENCEAILRCVPKVSDNLTASAPPVPKDGAPYVTTEELKHCDGLIVGSPTYFGLLSASLKYFLDNTTPLWLDGVLRGKPAAAFTSTGSMHGGQEVALFSMLTPLMHHGMLLVGLPYTHPGLMQTQAGGTPYGPSHLSGENSDFDLTETESQLCSLLGQRVAQYAIKLK